MIYKWEKPHADKRLLEWMLMHTLFVNSMPMMSGPQVGNSLEPQECFNKTLETVEDLNPTAKKNQYSES